MENFMRWLVLIPLIVALTQWLKSIIPVKLHKFLWIVAIGLWILAAFWYVNALAIVEYNTTMIIMAGIIAGLSASWLYEVSNNTVKIFKK